MASNSTHNLIGIWYGIFGAAVKCDGSDRGGGGGDGAVGYSKSWNGIWNNFKLLLLSIIIILR